MRVALDTNVMAYAEGLGDTERCKSAISLVRQLRPDSILLPAQTLGELHRVLTAKDRRTSSAAHEAVLAWADSFEVADSTWSDFQSAFVLAADHQMQIWDALIVSVAAGSRCRLLLSEDMQDGFTWRGVTVVNPFAATPASLLAGVLAKPR